MIMTKKKWFDSYMIYFVHKIKSMAIAMSPLELPPYVLLWIFEWSHPDIMKLPQAQLVGMLEGLRNSRLKIKDSV